MRHRRQAVKAKNNGGGWGARLRKFAVVTWRPLLVWILPILCLIIFCVIGLERCKEHVASNTSYRFKAPKLAVSNSPAWWEKIFDDQINAVVVPLNGTNMLDRDLPERVAQAYLRCPWVKEVRSVKKRFPNTVDVDLVIRMPAAAVAVPAGGGAHYYVIGDDGVRLPRAYSSWPVRGLGVPIIVGLGALPVNAGQRWNQPAIGEAVKLVQLLQSNPGINKHVKVAAVDVSNYGGRINRSQSEMVVITHNGCRIEWGRGPSTNKPGELPVEEKLEKFERFLAEGNPVANRTLDLRFAGRVVISRSIETDGGNS